MKALPSSQEVYGYPPEERDDFCMMARIDLLQSLGFKPIVIDKCKSILPIQLKHFVTMFPFKECHGALPETICAWADVVRWFDKHDGWIEHDWNCVTGVWSTGIQRAMDRLGVTEETVGLNRAFIQSDPEYVCPSCGRHKYEILTKFKKSGLTIGRLVEHHDHATDCGMPRGFPSTYICDDCNRSEGTAKKLIGAPAWFSFAPEEIGRFIKVQPNVKHELHLDTAKKVYSDLKVCPWFQRAEEGSPLSKEEGVQDPPWNERRYGAGAINDDELYWTMVDILGWYATKDNFLADLGAHEFSFGSGAYRPWRSMLIQILHDRCYGHGPRQPRDFMRVVT
jgi:hypothetical protein